MLFFLFIYRMCECEIFNPQKQEDLFAWMIEKFDEMYIALVKIGEIGDKKGKVKSEKLRSFKDD